MLLLCEIIGMSTSHRPSVQIFGVKRSVDTRKALRFFAERRIQTHFVNLAERPAARGELIRFAQRFGVLELVDHDSGRFAELGLRHARHSDDRWLEILVQEPFLLRMPLVRHGHRLSIGLRETEWKAWLTAEQVPD
jgi:arsenate reductase-like glutaredoxin family protein